MLELFRKEMARLDPACEVLSLLERSEVEPVFGFAEGLRRGTGLRGMLDRTEAAAVRLEPDLAVLVSFSGLHLPLGRRLRRRGVPVLYLGPPQVWAWGGWRTRQLRKAADKVACLFRFEEELLRRAGVDAEYFGYPLLDGVVSNLSREQVMERLGFRPDERYVVFLPGSRPAEAGYHVPLFSEVYRRLQQIAGGVRGVFVSAAEGTKSEVRSQNTECRMGDTEYRYDVMRYAECGCAVSGTVTAELAILAVPMVVSYHLRWLSRVMARTLVRTPVFALPNILAGTRLVPEKLEPSAEWLAGMLEPLLSDSPERRQQVEGLARVKAELGPPGAMARICMLAREMAGGGPGSGGGS